MVGQSVDTYEQREALQQLQRYLSDNIAPMIFADSMHTLLAIPPELTASQIVAWVASLHNVDAQLATADYLFHAAKKLHLLGELELIPRDRVAALLTDLRPHLLDACPQEDRGSLTSDFDNLELSQGVETTAETVGHIHRAGGESARGASVRVERPKERRAPGSTDAATTGLLRGLGRVSLLLDRIADGAEASTGSTSGSAVSGRSGAQTMVARIVTEAADRASSADELRGSLDELRARGLEIDPNQLLRLLAHNLPDWAPPATARAGAPPPQSAARAMGQVVAMSASPSEKSHRFLELVTSAVEEFNQGSLGRSVTMIDLAERLAESKQVDGATVAATQARAVAGLDEKRLREYLEDDGNFHLLRRMMRFFPRFSPDQLFSELEIEVNRDRRRFLLMLLSAQADETRKAALRSLQEVIAGSLAVPWFFQRNLVYLLRTTRRPPDAPVDSEIDVLIPMTDLDGALPLLREALATLGQIHHDRAATTLVARVSELEDALLGRRQLPHGEEELRGLLDSVVTMLARSPLREAKRCVIQHGLRRQPQLGDTLARLARLSSQDLSDDRVAVDWLVRALREELPTTVLGLTVISGRKSRSIERIILAMSGTDAPPIREVLHEVIRDYAGQSFAAEAAKTLSQLGTGDQQEAVASASLTGDLSLFGLPSLLQNLADSQLSGVLTLLAEGGQPPSAITLDLGLLKAATAGHLHGEPAVYQLLERPARGRFVFVQQEAEADPVRPASGAKEVAPILFEGIRRYDEFVRAATIAPDDARFRSTGKRPTNVSDEPNTDLVKSVWKRMLEGATPDVLEDELPVDSYRIRRLFEHWLGEGSIEPLAKA